MDFEKIMAEIAQASTVEAVLAATPLRLQDKPCRVCDAPVGGSSRRYCSAACREKGRRMQTARDLAHDNERNDCREAFVIGPDGRRSRVCAVCREPTGNADRTYCGAACRTAMTRMYVQQGVWRRAR